MDTVTKYYQSALASLCVHHGRWIQFASAAFIIAGPTDKIRLTQEKEITTLNFALCVCMFSSEND